MIENLKANMIMLIPNHNCKTNQVHFKKLIQFINKTSNAKLNKHRNYFMILILISWREK